MEPENIFDDPWNKHMTPFKYSPSRPNYGVNINTPEHTDINEKVEQIGHDLSRSIRQQYDDEVKEAMTQYAQNYSTGAVRDTTPDKLRYDLIDVGWLLALEDENRQDEQYDDDGNLTVNPYSDLDNVLECLYLALSKNDPSGLLRATNMLLAEHVDDTNAVDDLLLNVPLFVWRNLAAHLTETSKHYGYDNWRKGIPLSSYHQSFLRHYISWLNSETDEDHFSACLFNLMACWWTTMAVMYGRLPAELEDISPGQFQSLEWVR